LPANFALSEPQQIIPDFCTNLIFYSSFGTRSNNPGSPVFAGYRLFSPFPSPMRRFPPVCHLLATNQDAASTYLLLPISTLRKTDNGQPFTIISLPLLYPFNRPHAHGCFITHAAEGSQITQRLPGVAVIRLIPIGSKDDVADEAC